MKNTNKIFMMIHNGHSYVGTADWTRSASWSKAIDSEPAEPVVKKMIEIHQNTPLRREHLRRALYRRGFRIVEFIIR